MTDIFVHRTPAAYVSSDDLPTVKNYITEIVAMPSLLGWWSMLSSQVTLAAGKVASIANRKVGGPAASNPVAAQQGVIATSSLIGREVLDCPNDGITKNYPVAGLTFDSAGPWTMVAVCLPDDYVNRTVCGFQIAGTDWGSIFTAESGGKNYLRCRYGDLSAQLEAEAGWQAAIGAGIPSAPAKLELNGVYAEGGAAPSANPTTDDTFLIGNNGFNFFGEIAEIGLFAEDLFAPGAEARLALVREFITHIRTSRL